MEFHHVGLRAWEKQPEEDWVEDSRCWVTDPREHPNQIEWLRYEPDSEVPDVVKNTPHVAFKVDKLEPHLEGEEVAIPAFEVGEFARVAFIVRNGLVYEFMEFKPGHSWFDG